jgi:hypothetical protein
LRLGATESLTPMVYTNHRYESGIISDKATGVFPLGPTGPFTLISISGDTVSSHATALSYIAFTY